MDEELARWLQAEEYVVEEAHQGGDAATLGVVIKAAGPLTHGQLEGLGMRARQAHAEVTGPSCPPTAMAVQLPVVVA